MTCAALDFRHTMSCTSNESVLCAVLLAEACDPIIIGDQWTGKLDGRRDEKSIGRIAVLKMVQLVGAGSGPQCLPYRRTARSPEL
jgi:hypothetical protein